MLTAVDIQNKKFHVGLGYDKKDVNTFMEEIVGDYAKLFRMYAELKEENQVLSDQLKLYKAKESDLEKSIMLAEKDSEDTKSKATREAKTIEMDAKNKAKAIIGDAEERLEFINSEIIRLETQYAAYKSNFCSLMKMQYEMLKEKDFDVHAYIDEKAIVLLGGAAPVQQAKNNSEFGSFNGDPQMRDESSLGGMNNSSSFGSGQDPKNSTSAVYTSVLGDIDNFVDPFNPENNKRYNPFENTDVDNRNTKAITGNSNFKVNGMTDKKKFKRTPVSVANANSKKEAAKVSNRPPQQANNTTTTTKSDESASSPSLKNSVRETKPKEADIAKDPVKETIKEEVKEPVNDTMKTDSLNETMKVNSVTENEDIKKDEGIPTVSLDSYIQNEKTPDNTSNPVTSNTEKKDSEDEELVGDVEPKNGPAMLESGDNSSSDDDKTDEFGFEFL